jgi:hypothetical protein
MGKSDSETSGDVEEAWLSALSARQAVLKVGDHLQISERDARQWLYRRVVNGDVTPIAASVVWIRDLKLEERVGAPVPNFLWSYGDSALNSCAQHGVTVTVHLIQTVASPMPMTAMAASRA